MPHIAAYRNATDAMPHREEKRSSQTFFDTFFQKGTTSQFMKSSINTDTYPDLSRFTFTAKAPRKGNRTPMNKIKCNEERDAETGCSYFGARYYDPDLSALWLSVDPTADKYPGISPYAYCTWNPVRLVDPDGRDIWILIDNYRVKWSKNGLFNEDGSKYEGTDNFMEQANLALNAIYEDNPMPLSKNTNSLQLQNMGCSKERLIV